MSWQLWRSDEETGSSKRDDDHALPRHSRPSDQRHATIHAPRRSVILRLAAYLVALVVLAYLVRGIVRPALHPRSPRLDDHRDGGRRVPGWEEAHAGPPMDTPAVGVVDVEGMPPVQDRYDGPVMLPQLRGSLRRIAAMNIKLFLRHAVVFAAASLQSAAAVLPLACQMAAEGTNGVHFVLLSRSDVRIEELLKVNGIDETCRVVMHDARPTHSTVSTERRMALATARAFDRIGLLLAPKAVIVDSSDAEESYFLAGLRDQLRTPRTALIELPLRAGNTFSWLVKLDSLALAAWNDVHFDILIHAPPSGSGNLKRLLRSLSRADLGGMTPPHMTIQLPPVVDDNLADYLAGYRWPNPFRHPGPWPPMLSLRRRVLRSRLDEEEASVRFLESFWPPRPSHSHVVVLSAHTEVTTHFFHYIKYTLLRYRYSATAMARESHVRLMGLGLTTPGDYLNGTTFTPPAAPEEHATVDGGTSFLWQAPNSDAMLILGDRWAELHGYASRYLERRGVLKEAGLLPGKLVGKNHPAWLELALQLSRLRGYLTLYPSRRTADGIVGVHEELHDAPEEYQGESGLGDAGRGRATAVQAQETFEADLRVDMMLTLPNRGQLPSIERIPWLTWDGHETDQEWLEGEADLLTWTFRREVGGCSEEEAAGRVPDEDAKDLFCMNRRVQE